MIASAVILGICIGAALSIVVGYGLMLLAYLKSGTRR